MKASRPKKIPKGAWFYPVRRSYLPCSWQGWTAYGFAIVYILLPVCADLYRDTLLVYGVASFVVRLIVAGVILTYIAKRNLKLTPHVFQQIVLDYYYKHQRNLPWRQLDPGGTLDPYKVMVSEVMLQQTHVPRVIEKYRQFLDLYPAIGDLATAPLQDVLTVWQGLGYNRRGRFLRDAAAMVVKDFHGVMPQTVTELVCLPGIGHNTASAIAVYAYNQPLVFIETNIRTVYLHHFFPNDEAVTDAAILEVVANTLFHENPCEWYWALMDYGTYLKRTYGNQNMRSKHYVKQSVFKGSKRQVRGMVLRALTVEPQTYEDLESVISDTRLAEVLKDLQNEGLIIAKNAIYSIAA